MIEFKNQTDGVDEIYILDAIDEYSFNAEDFRESLSMCQGDVLNIHISSPGGSVFLGNTMANMIQDFKRRTNKKVVAIINGLCASIATQIALSADEVVMYKNSLFMIHLASCGMYGNKLEMLEQIELLDKIDKLLARTYADKTGMPIEKCIELMENETWLDAEECLEMGFIDSIVDKKVELVACANIDDMNFKNTDKYKELLDKANQEKDTKELLSLYHWLDDFNSELFELDLFDREVK